MECRTLPLRYLLFICKIFILTLPSFSVSLPQLQTRSSIQKQFNCCTVERYPNVFEKKDHPPYNLDGLALRYLDLLEKDETNPFSCRSITIIKGKDGTGFNDLLYNMERCTNGTFAPNSSECACELGVGGWFKTSHRHNSVRFLPEFLYTEFSVVTHVSNTNHSISSTFFLGGFSVLVWILIVILFMLFTFVRTFDQHFELPPSCYVPLPIETPSIKRMRHYLLKSKLLYRLRKAAMRTLFEMIGQSGDNGDGPAKRKDTTRQRILSLIITVCGLFFLLAYEATMTASLVTAGPVSAYHNVNDLERCSVDLGDFCIPRGGVLELLWNSTTENILCQNRKANYTMTHKEAIDAVANQSCKFIAESGLSVRDVTTGKHCGTVAKVGEPLFYGGTSFITPLNFDEEWFKKLETKTLKLREKGELETLEKYLSAREGCLRANGGQITFAQTKTFFILAFVLIAIMFVVMITHTDRPNQSEVNMFEVQTDPSLVQ